MIFIFQWIKSRCQFFFLSFQNIIFTLNTLIKISFIWKINNARFVQDILIFFSFTRKYIYSGDFLFLFENHFWQMSARYRYRWCKLEDVRIFNFFNGSFPAEDTSGICRRPPGISHFPKEKSSKWVTGEVFHHWIIDSSSFFLMVCFYGLLNIIFANKSCLNTQSFKNIFILGLFPNKHI